MNLQQLRIIRETMQQDFNLTEVSNALHTSQSGVSKHIKDLEEELGVGIFVRRGKRLVGLTEPGKDLAQFVQRILRDIESIKRLAQHFSNQDKGTLTVATTHTQARYALPPVVSAFKKSFPDIELVLQQASPAEIAAMLQSGEADIGIATEALEDDPDFVTFPYYSWRHAVIVKQGHPLADLPKITIQDLATYSIVTYSEGFTGRGRIDNAFAATGLSPQIAMSALDSDVIKTYVELGLGVGIIASMSFDPDRDRALRLISADDLFEANTTHIAVPRGTYLRGYTCRFIELCVPALTENAIRLATAE